MQFQIYDQPTSGSAMWSGEVHRTTVNGGLVNVLLGSKNPFPKGQPSAPDKPFFNQILYLQITVDSAGGQDGGPDDQISAADPPLLPRQVILPTTFAKESQNSAKLAGHDWSAILAGGSANPQTGKIEGTKIEDATITGKQIRSRSIEKDNLAQSVIQEFTRLDAKDTVIEAELAAGQAATTLSLHRLDGNVTDLQGRVQKVENVLKRPWTFFASDLHDLGNASLDALEAAKWEYAVVIENSLVPIAFARFGMNTAEPQAGGGKLVLNGWALSEVVVKSVVTSDPELYVRPASLGRWIFSVEDTVSLTPGLPIVPATAVRFVNPDGTFSQAWPLPATYSFYRRERQVISNTTGLATR
jgi:hypothetical protein